MDTALKFSLDKFIIIKELYIFQSFMWLTYLCKAEGEAAWQGSSKISKNFIKSTEKLHGVGESHALSKPDSKPPGTVISPLPPGWA